MYLCRQTLIYSAARDHIRVLMRLGHDPNPALINGRKSFSFGWQLFGYISTHKHSLQIDPQVLHQHQILQNLVRVGQVFDPLLDILFEWHIVSIAHERTKKHEGLFERDHDLGDAVALQQKLATVLELNEKKLLAGPVVAHLSQLGFDVSLFDCSDANVL